MNEVTSVAGGPIASPVERNEIESELKNVIGALKPNKNASNVLDKGKINEEQLYAAFVVGELRKQNPEAAEKLLSDLKSNFKKLKESGDPKPIFGAIEKSLAGFAKQGKLSKAESKRIQEYSLGMAQVDKRTDRLGSRLIEFKDAGKVDPKTSYMDRVFSKLTDNAAATSSDVKEITDSFKLAEDRGVKFEPKKMKHRIIKYEGETPVTGGPSKTSSERDIVVPVPNGSTVRFSSTDFGYKPISENDGKALIQIPRRLRDKIDRVEIVDWVNNSDVIATSKPGWAEDDGRSYARFSKPGTEFGSKFRVRLHFVDGFEHTERIENSKEVYSRML